MSGIATTLSLGVAPGPYSEGMNPRARRLIVSGVLGGLLLIVVITAIWQWLK
jgi:hypothetical protein